MFCKRRSVILKLEGGSSSAKFLITFILKNICERLFLKISISVTNSEAVFQRSFAKKGVLRNFAKFTVKHLCQSLLFDKVAGLRLWHRCFLLNFVKFQRTPFFIEHLWWLLLQIYWREVISDYLYPFKPFNFLNFAMAEWFCHVTCFSKVYPILFFFSYKHGFFYHKKVVTWKLQYFYYKEVMILSFLHRWQHFESVNLKQMPKQKIIIA